MYVDFIFLFTEEIDYDAIIFRRTMGRISIIVKKAFLSSRSL
jgi:hypothetical protein